VQGGGLTPQQASQILALEQEVAANPQDGEAWTQLGHVYFDTDNPDKAIRAYTKSLEINPNDANVLTDLGVMYRRAGFFQEALAVFDKARAIAPKHEQSRFNKGIVLMYDLGDINGAIAAWEELLEVNPQAQASNGVPVSQFIDEAKKQAAGN
jgi:cytochrome c-type biogenesis protein CcmH/NrfG